MQSTQSTQSTQGTQRMQDTQNTQRAQGMAEAQNTQNAYAAVQARIPNPAMLLPGVTEPVLAVLKAVRKAGVPQATLDLVHLRASQINGCSYCVHGGTLQARKAGERDERLHTVAAWADAPSSLRPSARRWRSPRPSPGSATVPTRYRTRSGTRPRRTTTSGNSPLWSS